MIRSTVRLASLVLLLGALAPAWGQGGDEAPKPFAPPGTPTWYPRTRRWDLRHTRLQVRFDWKERKVFGVETLDLAALGDGTRSVELDAADMVIREVRAGGGSPLTHRLEGERLSIDLPQPASKGQELALTIRYEATPKEGIYFVGPSTEYPERQQIWSQGEPIENRHWFPTWDAPDDKATSEMMATVPADMTAVSNGQLVGVTTDSTAGTRTFHWREEQPHSTYLISLVVGYLEEHREPGQGVPILYYVPRGEGDKVRPTFEKTADMVRFFGERLGYPYPWEKYAQTIALDFKWGGMENVSATTMTEWILQDERSRLDGDSEEIIAHELAHQWFGDLLTCRDWSEIWLNEGFATFFAAVYREHVRGEDEYLLAVRRMGRGYVSGTRRYRRPIVTRVYEKPISVFDFHAYPKGGAVLHMLRRRLGEDAFWRGMHEYVWKYRFQNVHTYDFMRCMEEASGQSLAEFFQQWVYSPGHPEFQVSWSWDDAARMAKLQVRQAQKTEDGTPVFHVSLKLLFEGPWGREEQDVEVQEAVTELQFKLPGRPEMVLFDSRHAVLKSLEFTKTAAEWTYQSEHGPDAAHRLDAVEALEKSAGEDDAREALTRVLRTDRVIDLRAAAARALGASKRGEAGTALEEALADKDARVRSAALDALRSLAVEATPMATARRLAETDPSYQVRTAALRLVAKRDPKAARPLLLKALAVPSLRDRIRSTALELLADADDPADRATLLAWTGKGRPLWARLAAIRALEKSAKGKPGRDALLGLVGYPMRSIRDAALGALANRKEPEAIPPLERLADAETDSDRAAAIRKTIDALRPPADVAQLRDRVRQLEEEQKKLQQRLEKVEERPGVRAPSGP
jgi:aminopeptidase N